MYLSFNIEVFEPAESSQNLSEDSDQNNEPIQ